MRMFSVCLLIFGWVIVIGYGCEVTTVYTTQETITSQGYPHPYTPGFTCTWSWQVSPGMWGIKFLDVHLRSQEDYIQIDRENHEIPLFIKDAHKSVITGTWMNVTFRSKNSSNPRAKNMYKGFKIQVLHGENQHDLNRKFLHVTQPPPKAAEPGSVMVIISILVIASIILILVLLVSVWFICQRRRRRHTRRSRPSQEVSLTVDVKAIRKDSGTRYVRKNSTQSESDAPRAKRPVVRSASSRSWVTRAEASLPSARVNQPAPTSPVVPNLYTAMDKGFVIPAPQGIQDAGDGYIMPDFIPQTGVVTGHGTLTRSRLPTLERVPENILLTEVPLTKTSVSSDDGYLDAMDPMPDCKTDTYLNCPVELPAADIQAKIKSRSTSGSSGYQNIRVTGHVQIS